MHSNMGYSLDNVLHLHAMHLSINRSKRERADGMATGGASGRSGGGGGGEDRDVLSAEELAQRPEVRMINKYAAGRAYLRFGLKGVAALALLWATVVLLGGFVSVLRNKDFWCLTVIAFLQAAGLSDAIGDDGFKFFGKWVDSPDWVDSEESYLQQEQKTLKRRKWRTPLIIIDLIILLVFFPVVYFAGFGPFLCILLSSTRLIQQDYAGSSSSSADHDASNPNLKPALNLFYRVSLVHSVVSVVVFLLEAFADRNLVEIVSRRYGFNPEILDGYFKETKRMCAISPASTDTWNLVTYGAGLLDSQLPEGYASGVRVVTMLTEQGVPIRRVLIRSPGCRIQKLIGALVWRSPVDGETRWLAARIVEHIAGDISLAQFPGALGCVSSLLVDAASCHSNGGDQEAPLQVVTARYKATRGSDEEKRHGGFLEGMKRQIRLLSALFNGGREESKRQGQQHVDSNGANTVITNGDMILQGLRIIENLAHDQHNCTVICNTKGLVSKITAPVSSSRLTQDIESNAAWIQVVDTSLKVVSRLMRAPGDTGEEIRRQISDSSNAVGNLEAILGLQSTSGSIIELQMRAMEVLAQLFSHDSTSWAGKGRENFIKRAMHIFLTVEWVGHYLAEEKKIKIENDDEMKGAMETANQLKEKAGEALVMLLSMGSQINSEAIRSFTDVVHRLGEIMTSKTIKCNVSETRIVKVEMKIECRISAAIILKRLCPHFTREDDDQVKKTILKKVLVELLHITAESQAQESSTTASIIQHWEHCVAIRRNDIENSRDGDQDDRFAVQDDIHQSKQRRLQAALLSLCADMHAKYSIKAPDLATMVAPQVSREGFVGRLKKMVEENSYATPACLAILKLICQMVEELISDDQTGEEIIDTLSQIVAKLSKASETMAGVESCMLFAYTDTDRYGVPVKPLLSVIVKQAEERLERKKGDLGINRPATRGP